MAEITRRALVLIKEMLAADGKIPAYNEEVVRQTLLQMTNHQESIASTISEANKLRRRRERVAQQQTEQQQAGTSQGDDQTHSQQLQQQQQQQQQHEAGGTVGDGAMGPDDWREAPELAAAIVVNHASILQLKRILLNYLKMRSDCLVGVRWQQRFLAADVRENLSPQEQQFYAEYDAALSKYMGMSDDGIGMDLTLDLTPPKDASVRVIVVRDHGSISCSHSASVPLVKGSVHNLRCSEAEHLVRLGVLRVLDPNA